MTRLPPLPLTTSRVHVHCSRETDRSLETWRAYNYPHVATVYWSLYRLARHYSPPVARRASWRWYLLQAARTSVAMYTFGGKGTGTSQWGLMVGSVFERILSDLEREVEAVEGVGAAGTAVGADDAASELRAAAADMRRLSESRMRKWLSMIFPYGSEFPWDSTGHEEIHTWLLRAGKHAAANKTVGAVLAYMALLPHWAYSGSARRYWDYVINGKTSIGNEREFHHYGSTLNAVAVLDSYRAYPLRGHLLRLGTAALLGHLSNIYPSGAASMAWHGDPALLRRDGYSGDYGIGLYGYWRSAAAYLDCIAERGWECMLCDIVHPPAVAAAERMACTSRVVIAPRDALCRRAYLAPLGLMVSVEGARIAEVAYEPNEQAVDVSLQRHEAAPSAEATLFLVVERVYPPPLEGGWLVTCPEVPSCSRKGLRDAHVIKLVSDGRTRVRLKSMRP